MSAEQLAIKIEDFEEVEFVVHAYDNDNWMADSIDTAPITVYANK